MKPILFNTEMVRAILDGRKTVTRRVVKPKYSNTDLVMFTNKYGTRLVERQNDVPPPEEITTLDGQKITRHHLVAMREIPMPYHPGDIMWVRETWAKNACGGYFYRADGKCEVFSWRPSIHMPREAASLFLRVTAVRVERLQGILKRPGDVAKEGIPYTDEGDREASGLRFKKLWDSTIKPADLPRYGWTANPWVWVIEFERCEKPEGGASDA